MGRVIVLLALLPGCVVVTEPSVRNPDETHTTRHGVFCYGKKGTCPTAGRVEVHKPAEGRRPGICYGPSGRSFECEDDGTVRPMRETPIPVEKKVAPEGN